MPSATLDAAISFGGAVMFAAALALVLLGSVQLLVDRWTLPARPGHGRVSPRTEGALFLVQGLVGGGAGSVLFLDPRSGWGYFLFVINMAVAGGALLIFWRAADAGRT